MKFIETAKTFSPKVKIFEETGCMFAPLALSGSKKKLLTVAEFHEIEL